jgi:signal transduction histidine kinase
MVQAFELMVDALPEPMLLVTLSGSVVAANEAMRHMLGTSFVKGRQYDASELFRTSPQQIRDYLGLCSGVRQFIPGALKLRFYSEPELDLLCEGAAVTNLSSGEHYIVLRLKPKAAGVDRFLGLNDQIESLNHEIAERRKVEEELRKARNEIADHAAGLDRRVQEKTADLRATIDELEAFSYSVSHDLRSPLRAITAYSRQLLDNAGSCTREAAIPLNGIHSASLRMDRFITDLLAYSQISRAERKLESIDIEKLIRELILQHPILNQSQSFIQIVSPLPSVIGDAPSLEQCISNLLTNAVKFMRFGVEPKIVISAEKVFNLNVDNSTTHEVGAADRVRLWFEDNGIGISRNDVLRIFLLFERVNPQSAYEGTGVGLAIVKRAVERMGGSVGVKSVLSEGSRFWIELQMGH